MKPTVFLCNVFSNDRRLLAEDALWTCGSQFTVSHLNIRTWTQGQCFFHPHYLNFLALACESHNPPLNYVPEG
jgi:hypothetical protein